jgi:hypothetical protein
LFGAVWVALPATSLLAANPSTLAEIEIFAAAEFRQERHVAALDRPLVSTGNVELSSTGFRWRQTHPLQVWLNYDGVSVTEKTFLGDRESSKTVADPIVLNLSRTLFSMMSGDISAIEQSFDIVRGASAQPDSGWRIDLVPRESAVRDVIPKITLWGSRYLNRVRVEEAMGGYTLIELTRHRPSL